MDEDIKELTLTTGRRRLDTDDNDVVAFVGDEVVKI